MKIDENFFKAIPIFGSFLIFCSVLNKFIFFKLFGINIVPFLELGEVLILFFDDLIVIAFSIIFFGGIAKLLSWYFEFKIKKGVDQTQNRVKSKKVLKLIIVISLPIVVVGNLFAIGMNICLDRWYMATGYLIVDVFLIIMIFLLFWFKSELKKVHKSPKELGVKFSLLLGIFVVISMNVTQPWARASEIIDQGQTEEWYFKFADDSEFETSDERIFIGKTKEYCFFYNRERKSTTILKMSEIELMEKISGTHPLHVPL